MRFSEVKEPKLTADQLVFKDEMVGLYKDQHDLRLTAYFEDKPAGYIDYATWRGELKIKYIKSFVERRGVATALLRHLQAQHPETEIDWGILTDDGAQLYKRVPMRTVPNEEVKAKMERLETLRASYSHMIELSDKVAAKTATPDEEREFRDSDRWNDLNDQIWELEQELRDTHPSRRFIRV